MKKYIGVFILGASTLTLSIAQASDRISLDQLLGQPDPVKTLETLKVQNPDNYQHLCTDIKDNSFFEKAKSAGIGTIKQTRIINACEGQNFEQGQFKKAIQKEKPAEAAKEVVQLKHVDLSKKGSVQEEQQQLQAAKKIMLENAELLGKKQEVEAQLIKVEEELKKAQESYDNLTAAIVGMREDLKDIRDFKVFKPHDHDHDSPEKFLEALHAALPQEAKYVLTQQSKQELEIATGLLAQANENIARARADLERINREHLQFTK